MKISMNTEAANVYTFKADIQSGIIEMHWKGYATSRQFREGTERMLNYLLERKAHKVLANAKEMTLIGREDQHWMEFNFLPRAIHAGFKACAMVMPESYFNKVAIESILQKLDPEKLVVKVFDEVEEARAWLMQAPPA